MGREKFLYVVDSLDRFGATVQLDLLTAEIAREHEVHVVVLCGSNRLAANDARTVHCLEADLGPTSAISGNGLSWRRLAQAGWKLHRRVQEIGPTIVHAWGERAEQIALLGLWNVKVRKFVTRTDVILTDRIVTELARKKLGEDVEKYIVTHEEVKKSMVAQRYDASKFEVVAGTTLSNPQSDRETARKQLLEIGGIPANSKIAATVAPLNPRSRLKDLIWATDLLTCIRDDVHLFIFGRGSQRWRLKKFASQTEAGHHIHFVDCEMDAVDLIPGVDFYWQSHLREPLSPALMYAMHCGVPAISVYGPGTADVIGHQETGFAANFGARDEFARWTKYLLEQTESGNQLARQGKESLVGKFTVEQTAAGWLQLYQAGQ